jgi:hypothetical protein
MKKNLYISLCMLLCTTLVCAEAPELQLVMPNSWKKLERVAGVEAEQVLTATKPAVDELFVNIIDMNLRDFCAGCTYHTVYREAMENAVFYRLVFSNSPVSGIASLNQWFYQVLVRKEGLKYSLYGAALYNHIGLLTSTEYSIAEFGAIDIVVSGKKAKGILFTLVGCGIVPAGNLQHGSVVEKPYTFYRKTKNQFRGKNKAVYYLLKDLEGKKITIESHSDYSLYEPQVDTDITITASDCLLDARCPLKYGIQNAFDGDPATSYVENTDDDLFYIEINFPYKSFDYTMFCQTIAFINGYAANNNLYISNNRIKNINLIYKTWKEDSLHKSFNLNDNTLGYQTFIVDSDAGNYSYKIYTNNVFQGNKYKDTCLAELNMKFNTLNWLFGDINE